MARISNKSRQRIAAVLYGVALAFLIAGIAFFALTPRVSALLEGVLPAIGIALAATSIVRGGSSRA
jgi:predicted acyltransferase